MRFGVCGAIAHLATPRHRLDSARIEMLDDRYFRDYPQAGHAPDKPKTTRLTRSSHSGVRHAMGLAPAARALLLSQDLAKLVTVVADQDSGNILSARDVAAVLVSNYRDEFRQILTQQQRPRSRR